MATFKARARALDMLGRQQIANVPTAISELFKNAHDAYAHTVDADYFRRDRLFVLRDDGIGMTEDEFTERWLTLGTESKLPGTQLQLPYVPPGETRRQMMGEKGIGRLAIASLGSQVLVLTRARRGNTSHGIVAAFIPWGLFTVPSVDLSDVEIPVRAFPRNVIPGADDVRELLGAAKKSLHKLQRYASPDLVQRMQAELKSFEAVDPRKLDAYFRRRYPSSPTLADGKAGTHFFVSPTDDAIAIDLAEPEGAKTAPPMVKMLIGFTNTLATGASKPLLRTSFRDHRAEDEIVDVAGESEFFSPSDLEEADHAVSGSFDEKGKFSGTVRVFEKTLKYKLDPVEADAPFLCGPFSVNFGYLQGAARESLLYRKDPEAFALLESRLEKIGGLYVYRDGIRVLPYGDTAFDFLKIEERRSKGAAYYFFSYRRMFGAVDLTREQNVALQEKAGREGFRRNKAYQQFESSLIQLLINLAAEFFREGGARADYFQERKEELDKGERLRRDRDKQTREQTAQFSTKLSAVFQRLDRGGAKKDVAGVVAGLESALKAAGEVRDVEAATSAVAAAEAAALIKLGSIRDSIEVARPRGMALAPGVKRDWAAYLDGRQEFERDTLAPARERIEVATASALRAIRGTGRKASRARAALAATAESSRASIGAAKADLLGADDALRERIAQLIEGSIAEVEAEISSALSSGSDLDPKRLSDEEFARERRKLEERLAAAVEPRVSALRAVRDVLADVAGAVGAGKPMPEDVTEALEEELLALREKEEADLQLTQLGMAIDIINHEFSASIRSVRGAIKRLKAWSDRNPALASVYSDLRASFDHLDGYLRLFTPLHRRLYREAVDIHGGDIGQYIGDLFRERLKRHNVELRQTATFERYEFKGYPSTFYPVFVNLVDNAIFWLSDRRTERWIEFDYDGKSMIVRDSGPGIPRRDWDAVFEAGFTRKPGGRGLGLYVSREVLRKAGFVLELASGDAGHGAEFRIHERDAASTGGRA